MTTRRPDAAVVDTQVLGAHLTRRGAPLADAYSTHLEGRSVFTSFVTLTQLRYGARLARWDPARLQELESALDATVVVMPGQGVMETHVTLRHECSAIDYPLGHTHHEANRWIAATARWLALPLITHDDIFHDTPGLTILTGPA